MFVVASIVIGAAAPAMASAKTVGNGANGTDVAVTSGKSLTLELRPANSGSSGYHWRVKKRPSVSVLKQTLRASVGSKEVFTYRAKSARTTSLKLQYVSPGRRARVAKTFRLRVLVAERAPHPGCFTGSAVVKNSVARVFTVGRNVVTVADYGARPHTLARRHYDQYFGCILSSRRVHPFDNGGRSPASGHANMVLRGSVVGYELSTACPFGDYCDGGLPPRLESQDIATGKLIRSVEQVNVQQVPAEDLFAQFVMSRAGGLAWIEQAYFSEGGGNVTHNIVYRSDLPAESAAAVADDHTVLDADEDRQVDPDSLELDGTEVTWVRGGKLQRAPLR